MKHAERPGVRRWTRHEYERLIDHGFLDEDDPIELLDGLLLVKEPQHSVDRVLEVHREPARPGPARRHRSRRSPRRPRASASPISCRRRASLGLELHRHRPG
jgi:hypothetical protein